MNERVEFGEILHSILDSDKVYFSPPEGYRIQYPCIVYYKMPKLSKYADDVKYLNKQRYEVTLIDKNPDSDYPDKILELPFSTLDRCFTNDNLNHYVFTIYR